MSVKPRLTGVALHSSIYSTADVKINHFSLLFSQRKIQLMPWGKSAYTIEDLLTTRSSRLVAQAYGNKMQRAPAVLVCGMQFLEANQQGLKVNREPCWWRLWLFSFLVRLGHNKCRQEVTVLVLLWHRGQTQGNDQSGCRDMRGVLWSWLDRLCGRSLTVRPHMSCLTCAQQGKVGRQ